MRLVLTILGEAERYGAVCLNGAEVTGLLDRDGRAAGVACVEARAASGSRSRPRTSSTRPASGPTGSDPEEIHDEAEVPKIAPSRGTHVTVLDGPAPGGKAACIVPAGDDRTIFALPWYGRTLMGTTDNDYSGDIAHVRPATTTSPTSSTPRTRSSAPSSVAATSPAPTPACGR